MKEHTRTFNGKTIIICDLIGNMTKQEVEQAFKERLKEHEKWEKEGSIMAGSPIDYVLYA